MVDSAPWPRLRPTGPGGKNTRACKYSECRMSPYLLSLGLSSSHVGPVFLAGPLSGLVVQPLIGALADGSTPRWGRCPPAAATVTAWAFSANDRLTVALALLSIFIIDFAVNACATLLLPTLLPFLHATSSLKALAPLVSLLLLACHLVTALLVRERVLLGGYLRGLLGVPRACCCWDIAMLPLPTLLPFLHATSSLAALAPLVSLLLIGCDLITALLGARAYCSAAQPTTAHP
ncbi:hypothetical protein C8J57DRAFT_1719956 [Mycena rebaudengoi]|nr:hypothetical protein C8J57DRAFT_1719956 [Mycena rebaudengoi]